MSSITAFTFNSNDRDRDRVIRGKRKIAGIKSVLMKMTGRAARAFNFRIADICNVGIIIGLTVSIEMKGFK